MITTASANYLYQAWIQYQGGLKIIGNDLIEKIYTYIYLSIEKWNSLSVPCKIAYSLLEYIT